MRALDGKCYGDMETVVQRLANNIWCRFNLQDFCHFFYILSLLFVLVNLSVVVNSSGIVVPLYFFYFCFFEFANSRYLHLHAPTSSSLMRVNILQEAMFDSFSTLSSSRIEFHLSLVSQAALSVTFSIVIPSLSPLRFTS
jgi:hypothetical protein